LEVEFCSQQNQSIAKKRKRIAAAEVPGGIGVFRGEFRRWQMTDGEMQSRRRAPNDNHQPATGQCKHIDESSGRVFLNVNSLEQPRWSLENRGFSFGKVFNLFDLIPYAKNIHFTLARRRSPPLWLRQTNKNQHRGD
jgi:hypothetical protein